MSAGKTTIMNAIHWCLYGKEPHFINEGEGKPIINQKALNETELAKSVEGSVEITFSNNGGAQFRVKRTLVAYRKTDLRTKIFNSEVNGLIDAGISIEKTEQIFSYVDKEAGGWQYITDVDSFNGQIERLLPENLSTFIFFNGEMLDKFFSRLQTQNVRNGIERVSGLVIVDNAIDHLGELEKIYRKKAVVEQGELTYQNERRDRLQHRLDPIIPELNTKKDRENKILLEQGRLKEILKNNSEALIKSEEAKLTQATKNRQTIKELLNKIREERRDFITRIFARVLLLEPVKKCLAVLKEAEEKGITPPPVDSTYMQQMLTENMCICGSNISEGTDGREKIKKLIDRFLDSEIASEATEGRIVTSDIIQSISDKQYITERLNSFRQERNNQNEKNTDNESTITGIYKKLQEFDIEKIRSMGEQLEKLDEELITVRARIMQLEGNKGVLEKELGDINTELDKATAKSVKAKYWKDRQNLAREAKEALQELREDTLLEIRSKVEERTNKIFKKLIYRRWQLEKVEISPDYKIKVLDKEGVDNLKTLSAGQTLYLSLSFISALREVTAINYPMVIDSPFGKVSGQERVWAADDLPKFLPDTQITFLVTDTEYSSSVSNILTNETIPSIRDVLLKNERVWREFNLILVNEDKISSKTEVKPIEQL